MDIGQRAQAATIRVKVWDGWIRAFHWAIVALLAFSFVTGKTGRMELHMLSGYAVLTLLVFRVAWGLVGSETARFGRFLRSPLAALAHLRRLRAREPDAEIGHNAAGGWMVLAMLALLLFQAVSGLFADDEELYRGPLADLVGYDASQRITDLHVANVNLVLAAVALHVLAVAAYRLLKGQNLIGPMVTGMKALPADVRAPRLGSPALAAALLVAAAALVYGVVRFGGG
jgi:cytochrome b